MNTITYPPPERNAEPDAAKNGTGSTGRKPRKRNDSDKVSARIARDLQAWGYDLWLNDLDDDVYNGHARLDDPAWATLRMTARDAGYAENRLLGALEDAVLSIAAQNRRHPLREHLGRLRWDGGDHIAQLAGFVRDKHEPITYPDGTQRSVFHAFSLRWLIGSVAKIHGDSSAAQANTMLVLAAAQGIGKSRLAQLLCPLPEYFLERSVNPDDKDNSLAQARVWVWEVGELGATTRRTDAEALKKFITIAKVAARKAYGRNDTVKPAIASFLGTVNPDGAGFLIDTTGNRRFAVVEVESIDWAYSTKVDINQVWAQAMHLWKLDPRSFRFTASEEIVQADNADAQMADDVIKDMIVSLYDVDSGQTDWRITSSELLHNLRTFGELSRGNDKQQGKDIARSLATLGIVRDKKRSNGATTYRGIRRKE